MKRSFGQRLLNMMSRRGSMLTFVSAQSGKQANRIKPPVRFPCKPNRISGNFTQTAVHFVWQNPNPGLRTIGIGKSATRGGKVEKVFSDQSVQKRWMTTHPDFRSLGSQACVYCK
jgi:hypothetical protein